MSNEEKLAKAKDFLGTNWVLHPLYKSNPKHKVFP